MKRELSFLSPLSIAFLIVVFAGLGFAFWKSGGLGFSPGRVTAQTRPGVSLEGFAAHADFEKDCQRCHQPLVTGQTELLCTQCHTDIAQQRVEKTGTHGRINLSVRCAACHPEHQGAGFDPVAFAVAQFDHNQTRLPLTGAHTALDCGTCHGDGDYQLAYQGCTDCHAEPERHAGVFEGTCETCHTDLSWKPAMIAGQPFDHNETRFSLVRHTTLPSGGNIPCASCHAPKSGAADLAACTACHTDLDRTFMEEHTRMVGDNCLQCHDGTDRMEGFDHAALFPLDGRHSQLACTACHTEFHFQDTPGECSSCHQEPDVHAGFFGIQCQDCHTSQAWRPARLTRHAFPLDHGGQGEVSCQTCHPASYPEYTCYACHEHQPEKIASEHREEGISTEELAQCIQCHPGGRKEEGGNHDE